MPTEESGSLHRLFDLGGAELYMTDGELAVVQELVYYCDDCAAYHVRPEVQQHEFIKALNASYEQEGTAYG